MGYLQCYMYGMKGIIKVLLSCFFIFFLAFSKNNGIPPINSLTEFEGIWTFEKAEYLERKSNTDDFQVKFLIKTTDELEALPTCFHQSVKKITIGEIAYIDCPQTFYCGRATIVTFQEPKGEKKLLTVGLVPEDLGKESPIAGIIFNIIGLKYWIEKVDDNTIAMTLDTICTENSVEKNAAVKCFLKKMNRN